MVRRVQNKILPVRAIWELLSALVKPTSYKVKWGRMDRSTSLDKLDILEVTLPI